jgi:hypothetical protein
MYVAILPQNFHEISFHLRILSVRRLSNNFDKNINKTDYNFECNVYISHCEILEKQYF